MPQLIGCGVGCSVSGFPEAVGCVVGAEKMSEASGVWVKTRFYREGNFLCATVYSVAAGEPKIIELRVDLRPIARAVMRAHSAMHASELAKVSLRGKVSGTTVGWGLGSLWKGAKKAAKAIGRNKLVKSVVKVTKAVAKTAKTVIKSKVTGLVAAGLAAFPLTAPIGVAALGAYAAANAAVAAAENGSKVVKTAQRAATTIARGVGLAKRVAGTAKQTTAAVRTASSMMTPAQRTAAAQRATNAARLQLNARGKAAVKQTLARVPVAKQPAAATAITAKLRQVAQIRQNVALAKALPRQAGAAVLASTKLQLTAAPALARAAATAKALQNPAVRKKLVDIRTTGAKAEALLRDVQRRAQSGSLDAKKSAMIVNLVARNRARIQAMSQANAGGLPGVLITQDGKLKRGRFRIQAVAAQGGLLYQGSTVPKQRGSFQLVSGVTLESIAVNGDLPLDGVRLTSRGANSGELGPYEGVGGYELVGCGNTPCEPCARSA